MKFWKIYVDENSSTISTHSITLVNFMKSVIIRCSFLVLNELNLFIAFAVLGSIGMAINAVDKLIMKIRSGE